MAKKISVTAKKSGGDDAYSWAVFADGVCVYTGVSRHSLNYYKRLALNYARARRPDASSVAGPGVRAILNANPEYRLVETGRAVYTLINDMGEAVANDAGSRFLDLTIDQLEDRAHGGTAP